ncbi:hypothetical protein LAZ67_22000685 [Cordylochernes scorpioides]|uniref:Mariner Mos1 transposase n=1 Tax=Cordylochernes scorpioides TaxID=51811 RepID=A0ABY6LQ82_9ARAC|nr:hypothetical protein LAZ67_22000685 [Cordylochernes scorpioides]
MRLSRALKIKRPLYTKRHDKVIYQHDNAQPHVAKVVKETLEVLQLDVLPHPLYSPDIAPSDYHMFRSMTHGLAEQHFTSYEEAKNWVDVWIASKDKEFFQHRIRMLPERWEKVITHSEHPKYLGIHLDRTLTFKTHLTKLKGKLSSRNNILHKLAGSSWGSDANTLRTSALALIFSTAEYCAPGFANLQESTGFQFLLTSLRLSYAERKPPRKCTKNLDSPDLEINPILQSPPKHRLKSRNPIWSRGNQLLSQNFNISEAWTNSWISSDIPNKNLITSPSVKIPGFSLPRREWVLLNRFRTGQGRCAELMKLWGYTKDPNCACNVPQSMSHILDDCPLYKFNGGISNLHSVTPEALNWLKALPLRL